jgi:MerR family transcriptional regulator, thiopeptide resistance regulator
MYTVKQLSDLAHVSVRTLHYYDEIGLLTPSQVGANGYRYYDNDSLLRLQQILFYRELDFDLTQIGAILDDPNFDYVTALRSHRALLRDKQRRLDELISTVDSTIMHIVGEVEMSDKRLFEPFTDEEQKHYERLARLEYGPANVNESIKRWNSYSKAQQEAILKEGGEIYAEIAKLMNAGVDARDEDVQALLVRWHNHIHYFYTPTLEIVRGLGELYATNPDFHKNISKIGEGLPEFLREGITFYVDELETLEIERMLTEDAARAAEG